MDSHRWAIQRAGVHPHHLRRKAATEIRREYGNEIARIILGHRSVVVTKLYTERNWAIVLDVMWKMG